MKAHITGRHCSCKVIRGSGRVKPADLTEGSPFLKAMPPVILPSPTSYFPPSGSQQGYTLNHFVLYLEKLSDRSFCEQHKSISSCYRAKKYDFLSCWLCKFWTLMALVERHQGIKHTRGQIVLLLSREMPAQLWRFPAFYPPKNVAWSLGWYLRRVRMCVSVVR